MWISCEQNHDQVKNKLWSSCEQAMDKSWKDNEQFMNELSTRNEQVTSYEQVIIKSSTSHG